MLARLGSYNSVRLSVRLSHTCFVNHLNFGRHNHIPGTADRLRRCLLSSPVIVINFWRSAAKWNLTAWCSQNLSNRALNALTVQASTTELGKLFQILTVVKCFRGEEHNEKIELIFQQPHHFYGNLHYCNEFYCREVLLWICHSLE